MNFRNVRSNALYDEQLATFQFVALSRISVPLSQQILILKMGFGFYAILDTSVLPRESECSREAVLEKMDN